MVAITDSLRCSQLHEQIIDLKYKISEVAQTKASLLRACDDLMPVGTDYDPESPMMKMLQERQNKVKIIEKQLDQKMARYQRDLQAAEAEYDSCNGRLGGSIKSEISYGSGG